MIEEGNVRPSLIRANERRWDVISWYNGRMKQWLAFIVVGIIIVIAGFQLFRLYAEKSDLTRRLSNFQTTVDSLTSENQKLETDIEYFGNEENLVKELKSKFNYVELGEKLMIIVPGTSSSSTSTQ